MKKKLIIFASGNGSNFEAIAQACKDGRIDAEVSLMVCDVPGAKVIERAERFGVKSFVFNPKSYATKADYEKEIVGKMEEAGADLVCLAGYMRIIGETLLEAYEGRIINIHPSLLPAFRGANAVEQAVEYGVKVFGISIHYVNSELDGGKIIAQKAFEYDGNDPEEVHRLGHIIEHELYVNTINKLLCER